MKGKKLTKEFDFIGGIVNGFGGMAYESQQEKEDRKVLNNKLDNYTIDTCFCNDTLLYETGISCEWINNSNWVIVEEYKTKKEAQAGHKKWLKHMKTKPKKLWSIQIESWEK